MQPLDRMVTTFWITTLIIHWAAKVYTIQVSIVRSIVKERSTTEEVRSTRLIAQLRCEVRCTIWWGTRRNIHESNLSEFHGLTETIQMMGWSTTQYMISSEPRTKHRTNWSHSAWAEVINIQRKEAVQITWGSRTTRSQSKTHITINQHLVTSRQEEETAKSSARTYSSICRTWSKLTKN